MINNVDASHIWAAITLRCFTESGLFYWTLFSNMIHGALEAFYDDIGRRIRYKNASLYSYFTGFQDPRDIRGIPNTRLIRFEVILHNAFDSRSLFGVLVRQNNSCAENVNRGILSESTSPRCTKSTKKEKVDLVFRNVLVQGLPGAGRDYNRYKHMHLTTESATW